MEDRRRNTYIGLALIAVVALLIAVLPRGGDFTRFVTNSIQAGFLAAIGLSVAQLYRSQSMWLNSLPDRDRGILYGAGGGVTLTFVANEHWQAMQGGVWIKWGIIAGCVVAAYWVWRESKRYAI